ncbi:hypothetical protein [Rhizobium hainanense]|uniref:Uncharacterized protein n=1 Tax=Rhizobium hainanense TaxID=52131 RepID=A0A1C3WLC3_9HYPH|nr:hypothetical protein [Rhizobium hainanense]SCB40715.1 hypothetical protein GA0061100_12629 [Rhizobium hainanense]
MTNAANDQFGRQILVNLGNRWAVLGTALTLPGTVKFSPADGKPLDRVADEADAAEQRIYQTLRVSDAEVVRGGSSDEADLVLIAPDGSRTLVEIKVREYQPKAKDLEPIFKRLVSLNDTNLHKLEVWVFNVERLRLHIYSYNGRHIDDKEFAPLNIWEYDENGSSFERKSVAAEVEEWLKRLEDLYLRISEWVKPRPDISVIRTRTVEMSEELMQKFAVADRELSVLDLGSGLVNS